MATDKERDEAIGGTRRYVSGELETITELVKELARLRAIEARLRDRLCGLKKEQEKTAEEPSTPGTPFLERMERLFSMVCSGFVINLLQEILGEEKEEKKIYSNPAPSVEEWTDDPNSVP